MGNSEQEIMWIESSTSTTLVETSLLLTGTVTRCDQHLNELPNFLPLQVHVAIFRFFELTLCQLHGKTKSCNLIGPFGIPKRKGFCAKKVRLEHQTFFHVWARDHEHLCYSPTTTLVASPKQWTEMVSGDQGSC